MKPNFNCQEFLQFLDKSPTNFHAVQQLAAQFEEANFTRLSPKQKLQPGDRFYHTVNESAFFAGIVGEELPSESGFGIIAVHTDWPTFRVKPNPVIRREGLIRLNTEPYGGLIWDSWMDRPLGLAGRIIYSQDGDIQSKLFHIDKDLLTIPHVAMHIDGNANAGHIYSLSDEMLPVITEADSDFDWMAFLANEAGVSQENLLDLDCFLIPREKACLLGADQNFISAPRMDNLAMTYTGAIALQEKSVPKRTALFAAFDYEEIGSRADTGADSPLLIHFLEELVYRAEGNRYDFLQSLSKSFLVSADMAHAVHPAHPDKSDATNRPHINKGPVVKYSARHRYTTTAQTAAVIKTIAGNIPLQTYVNRSEICGGSTAGMHIQAQTGIRGIDIGCPLLGMHAFRELGGVKDLEWITELFHRFYML